MDLDQDLDQGLTIIPVVHYGFVFGGGWVDIGELRINHHEQFNHHSLYLCLSII